MSEPRLLTAPGKLKCAYCSKFIRRNERYWFWWYGYATVRMHNECYKSRAEGLTQQVES